jgi:hypothetical protein
MATKKHFFGLGTFSIKDGSEIRFWEDKWLGTTSLWEQDRHFTTLCGIKAIPSLRFWRLLLRMCRSEEICLVSGLFLGMPYY